MLYKVLQHPLYLIIGNHLSDGSIGVGHIYKVSRAIPLIEEFRYLLMRDVSAVIYFVCTYLFSGYPSSHGRLFNSQHLRDFWNGECTLVRYRREAH